MGTPPASAFSEPPGGRRTPEGSGQARRLRFPASLRIRRRRDFQRVLSEGRRASNQYLTVWLLPNGSDKSRLGLIVGQKHGGAVRRNRLKRILREAFRLCRGELPVGFDVVCAPREGVPIRLEESVESLIRLVTRLSRPAR